MRYPIVIHKDEGSCYGVTVPDLPGCFSAGYTLDETFEMAREAIEGHCVSSFPPRKLRESASRELASLYPRDVELPVNTVPIVKPCIQL